VKLPTTKRNITKKTKEKIFVGSKFAIQVIVAAILNPSTLGLNLIVPSSDLIINNLRLRGVFEPDLLERKEKEFQKIINASLEKVKEQLTEQQKAFIEKALKSAFSMEDLAENLASPQINDKIESLLEQHVKNNPGVLSKDDLSKLSAVFLENIVEKVVDSQLFSGQYNDLRITMIQDQIKQLDSSHQDLVQWVKDFVQLIMVSDYHPELYRDNSKVQLTKWKTDTGKLYNVLHEDDKYIPMKIKDNSNEYTVEDVLTKLKDNSCCHAILIGEGGMGKTTTCIRLWDICLKSNIQVFYVPLCDYNATNTIHRRIVDVYGVEENNYNRLMDEETVVLLLDGLNEMKTEPEYNQAFLEELKKLATKKNIQILITSRNDVIPSKTSGFTRLAFKPIDKEAVDDWLKKHAPTDKKIVRTPELYTVLS